MNYIAQVIAFQLIFILIYQLFLRKETFFHWNRIYLLGSLIISFILPFMQIAFVATVVPAEMILTLPTISPTIEADLVSQISTQSPTARGISTGMILSMLWLIGSLIWAFIFLKGLLTINTFKSKGKLGIYKDVKLINLDNSEISFSFLNTIFIGNQVDALQRENILEHEYIHIKGKHSFDKLLCELIKIVLWFNPAIYLYHRNLTTLHEFIADESTIEKIGKKEYYQELLSKVFNTKNVSFVNTFFNHSLIKKRILMLKKTKSNKNQKWKYIMVIPLMALMIFFVSSQRLFAQKNKKDSNSEIIRNIEALRESLAKKGNISDEEDKELQALMLQILPGGLSNPNLAGGYEVAEFPLGVVGNMSTTTVPLYTGCEVVKEDYTLMCMSSKVQEHFRAVYEKGNVKSGKNIKSVDVYFKIDRDGNITDVNPQTKNSSLKKEVERVFATLATMTPATIEGNKVAVTTKLSVVIPE